MVISCTICRTCFHTFKHASNLRPVRGSLFKTCINHCMYGMKCLLALVVGSAWVQVLPTILYPLCNVKNMLVQRYLNCPYGQFENASTSSLQSLANYYHVFHFLVNFGSVHYWLHWCVTLSLSHVSGEPKGDAVEIYLEMKCMVVKILTVMWILHSWMR